MEETERRGDYLLLTKNEKERFLVKIEDLLDIKLMDSQKDAVMDDLKESIKIDAGAGSGKSTTISVLGLMLLHAKVQPSQISYLTFTNKASFDMKKKINDFSAKVFPEMKGIGELTVGTFHSTAFEWLCEHNPKYRGYQLYSDLEMKVLIGKYKNQSGWGLINKHRKDIGIKTICQKSVFLKIMSIFRESKIRMGFVQEYLRNSYSLFTEFLDNKKIMDYSSLLETFYRELNINADFQERIQKKLRYLCVDEYQDVNHQQEKILRRMHELGIRVIVVGDGNQNIYSWRGSDNSYIEEFNEHYGGKRYILGDNFRSSDGIVDFSKAIIEENIKLLSSKRMKDTKEFLDRINSAGPYPYYQGDITYKEFENSRDEAIFIANTIKILLQANVPPGEIAILLRKKKFASVLIETLRHELIHENVVIEIGDLSNLFVVQEILAVRQSFYYLAGQHIRKELRPKRKDVFQSWMDLHPNIVEKRLNEALDYLEDKRAGSEDYEYRIQQVYQRFLKIIGFEDEEVKDAEMEGILYNLIKFTKVIDDFEKVYLLNGGITNIAEFCYFIKNEADSSYEEGTDQFEKKNSNSILITTIHQAKGLEFHTVFLPMLSDNEFPNLREYGQTPWHILSPDSVVNSERYRPTIENERRLFYVAASRAKKFLFMSRASTYKTEPTTSRRAFSGESVFGRFAFNHELVVEYSSFFEKRLKEYQYTGEIKENEEQIVVNVIAFEDMNQCLNRSRLTQKMGLYQPINRNMGYGESVHNVQQALHESLRRGLDLNEDDIKFLVSENMNLPFMYKDLHDTEALYNKLTNKAVKGIKTYYDYIKSRFKSIEAIEKPIEAMIDGNILLKGRVDLDTRREIKDGGLKEKVFLTDNKTRKNKKDIKEHEKQAFRDQLYTYAYVYKHYYDIEVDMIEVLNLGSEGKDPLIETVIYEPIDSIYRDQIGEKIIERVKGLQKKQVPKICDKEVCQSCYVNYFCLSADQKREFDIFD